MAWLSLGDHVSGTYLRREVSGAVINVDFTRAPYAQQYTIKLDTPVRVTNDDSLLDFTRARIIVTLNEDGQSVDTKNRQDAICHLSRTD